MANTITPIDSCSILNAMAVEMWGANNTLTAFDTTTFASVGEAILRTGYENTLNSLGVVLGKSLIDVSVWRGKMRLIMRVPEEYGFFTRKISFYSGKLEEAKNFNTDVNGSQIVDGASIDPWKITKTYPLQLTFGGMKLYQKTYTVFKNQMKQAFRSPEEFARWVSGIVTQVANDLAVSVDAENRLQILNAIGATYNVGAPRQVVNLVTEYNAYYGTTKTATDLLTTDFEDLMKFFVMRLKGDMSLMSEYNEMFHIYPAKTDDNGNSLVLNRDTPPESRRLIMCMPRIRQAEATIFPSLFDTSYLRIENYEGIEYWQNPNIPEAVNIEPNQLNVSTGQSEDGNAVALDNVFALLFDERALMTSVHFEDADASPYNQQGQYYNVTYSFGKDYQLDQTHNMVLYYVA